jgi:WD40 repeat protein
MDSVNDNLVYCILVNGDFVEVKFDKDGNNVVKSLMKVLFKKKFNFKFLIKNIF